MCVCVCHTATGNNLPVSSYLAKCFVLMCVAERGKGRQRQAILGEHPSNGYGILCPPVCLYICPLFILSDATVCLFPVLFSAPSLSVSQAHTAPCCLCLLTAGTGGAVKMCRTWFLIHCFYLRTLPPLPAPLLPSLATPSPALLPWWVASIPPRWTAAASSTSSACTGMWRRCVVLVDVSKIEFKVFVAQENKPWLFVLAG